MDNNTYMAKREAVFQACRTKTPARWVVAPTSLTIPFRLIHVAYYLVSMLAVAGIGVGIELLQNLPGTLLGSIGLVVGLALAGAGDYFMMEQRNSSMGFVIASRVISFIGFTHEMHAREASSIRELVQVYPEFVPILAKWGASVGRGSALLGYAHSKEFFLAVRKLEKLSDIRVKFQNEERNRNEVQEALESCGIISAIEARRLEVATPQAVAPMRHSRL